MADTFRSERGARTIAVFLGANSGEDPKFEKLARDLAHVFFKQSWSLGKLSL